MTTDSEEQEDELLALQSIFSSEEFGRKKSNVGGEIRVCVELPAGFTVAIKEGKTTNECWPLLEKYAIDIDSVFDCFSFKVFTKNNILH